MNIKLQAFRLFIVFLCCAPQGLNAGRDPEDWDTLPQIQNLTFSNDSIGFSTSDSRFFILNRQSESLSQIESDIFLQRYPDSKSQKPSDALNDSGTTVLLRTSSGIEFQTQNAYCSEGENAHHSLSRDGKILKDHVKPCHSISAVEKVGAQLWLGTRYDGEYGNYPAEGIVVQSLDSGKLIRKIDSKNGLAGDLVRIIRQDPHADIVWVGTEQGLSRLNKKLEIVRSHYFYEDFDPQTGRSAVFLATRRRISNPFAVTQRRISSQRPKAFYEAVQGIPQQTLQRYSPYFLQGGISFSANVHSETAFVPKEMNVLVPFFIDAAAASNRWAISMLCMFNDNRVVEFFLDLEKKTDPYGSRQRAPNDCLDKYGQLGLLNQSLSSGRAEELLTRIRSALNAIKRSSPGNISSSRNPQPLGSSHVIREVYESVESLKKLGDTRGMQLINDYFAISDGRPQDGYLYEGVVQHFYHDDEIVPAVLSGLKNIQTGNLSRGCSYLNMKYMAHKHRYDAKYAEAIVIALDHVTNQSETMRRSGNADYAQSVCREALQSQLQDLEVKNEFMKRIYHSLPLVQKAIVNGILQ